MNDLVLQSSDQPRELPQFAKICLIVSAWLMIFSLPLYALVSFGLKKLPDSGYAKQAFEEGLGIQSSEVHHLHAETIQDGAWPNLFRFSYRDKGFPERLVSRWSLKKVPQKDLSLRGMDQWRSDLAQFEFYEGTGRARVWIERGTKRCFIRLVEIW